MRRRTYRYSFLAPMVTTIAFILIAQSTVSGFGQTAEAEQTTPVAVQSDPAALEPVYQEDDLSYRDASLSYRGGGRPDDVVVARPLPIPVATATTQPSPTASPTAEVAAPVEPAPAREPSPEPERSPEPTPVPEPVADPTSEPVVALSQSIERWARVGIQSGHLDSENQPAELAALRKSTGAAGKGWTERGINLEISQKVVGLLEERNLEVDLLPATVPPGYQADAFVSIHGDANVNTDLSGYKVARAKWSKIPQQEDALVDALRAAYQAGTGLPEHRPTITQNMLQYYAFDYRQLDHAVAPTTPSAILEMGFLTNSHDRQLLQEEQDRVAEAIVNGIIGFLEGR